MLPPGLGTIIFADSTTSIALYRTIRDGTIISSRAMVRKILSGCGKATVGKLMRNLLLWSVPTKNMIATSAALHHSLTLLPEPFHFLENGLTHYEFEDDDPEIWDGQNHEDPNENDYAILIANHMNLVQVKPLEEAVHDNIMPICMEIV